MRHSTLAELPTPRLRKMRWPAILIWLIPLAALGISGYYAYDYFENRKISVTVSFHDATGLKPGETIVSHLGVTIGQVETVELSRDQNEAVVHLRLNSAGEPYARKDALYWIVRPQVSAESISGLGTIASGPYISAVPGKGERETEFTGLEKPPSALGPGLTLRLQAVRLERVQQDSPVFYRGFQVGVVQNIQLTDDATGVNIQIFIWRRYAELVRSTSVFWLVNGIDLKGGILSGLQMKVESLRSLISGGITFAAPDKAVGVPVREGAEFPLYEEPKPEWENWAPSIPLPAENAQDDKQTNESKPKETTIPAPK